MPFAITQSCCNDAHCVSVCPVNCIHPTPDEPEFGHVDQLFVDPRACIDCGACASACPVDAIFPVSKLTAPLADYARRNAAYYDGRPEQPEWAPTRFPRTIPAGRDIRVAIIGTGPAACYAAQAVLRTTDASVTIIDREEVPGGLVRYGVAPDHPSTKRVGGIFAWIFEHPRVHLRLGTEVGKDTTLDRIMARHDAVIACVGALEDRRLGIPGEDLPGVVAGGEFARWANGHPGADAPDLSSARVVVIGNGNVALDVARLLVSEPDSLPTDLAPHVVTALRHSAVREVVVLGRRGPEFAAYTESEVSALRHLPGVQLVVDDTPGVGSAVDRGDAKAVLLQGVEREAVDYSGEPQGRRIVLRFGSAPTRILGGARTAGVAVGEDGADDLPAGLVVTSIGRRGRALPGMPFDEARGVVPNDVGRVVDPATGEPVPGLYVAGWIKRGSTGGIGTNRFDAEETVEALIDDAIAGRLPPPPNPVRKKRSIFDLL